MNKFFFTGKILKDKATNTAIDYRMTNDGDAWARFRISVRAGKDKYDYFTCTAFKKTAENIKNHFIEGKAITVEGHIKNNNYPKKDGNTDYTDQYIVDRFYFVPSNPKKEDQ